MWDQPFGVRLAVLVAVLATLALAELLIRGRRAERYREYAFLLAAGLAAGVIGAVFDQLSVSISPEYFTTGKGLAPGPGLRPRVAALGFEAGCTAGVSSAALWLWANRSAVGYRSLAGQARLPVAYAALGAAAGALLAGILGGDAFTVTWGLHGGLYLGLGGGVLRGFWRLRRPPGVTGEPDP